MNKKQKWFWGVGFVVFCGIVGIVGWKFRDQIFPAMIRGAVLQLTPQSVTRDKVLQKFSSAEDVKEYLARASKRLSLLSSSVLDETHSIDLDNALPSPEGGVVPDAFSGISSPNAVQDRDQTLFISQGSPVMVYNNTDSADMPVRLRPNESTSIAIPSKEDIHIINTELSGSIELAGIIPGVSGPMLLSGDRLAIFDRRSVVGYDVEDPRNPEKAWTLDFEEGTWSDAQLINGSLYLIHQTILQRETPCPFSPIVSNDRDIVIACSDILHPYTPIPATAVYTVLRVNIETGLIEKKVSFLGSDEMSITTTPEGIYVWYSEYRNALDVMYDFLRTNNTIVSQDFFLRVERLRDYDISDESKVKELMFLLDQYESGLDSDVRLRFQNDLDRAMTGYFEIHKRDLAITHIFSFDVETLEARESGTVSGVIQDRDSFDVFRGVIRVSTVLSGTVAGIGVVPEEEYDVFALDASTLRILGSVSNIGKGRSASSVRFVGDRGYIITSKQSDPVSLVDLHDPSAPRLAGALNISGASSLMYPLEGDRVLGISIESGRVRLTLFDVSDAENPRTLSTVFAGGVWPDVLSAYRQGASIEPDKKYIFLPGRLSGGLIISYDNDTLTIVYTISGMPIRQALFMGDAWYGIGDRGMSAYKTQSWRKAGEVIFDKE